jgi:hypothetical protein
MDHCKQIVTIALRIAVAAPQIACAQDSPVFDTAAASSKQTQVLPASDPSNTGNWTLREDNQWTVKVWVAPKTTAKSAELSLQDPPVQLPAIDLASCARGEWVTLTEPFRLLEPSGPNDSLKISIHQSDCSAGNQLIYFDAIAVTRKGAAEVK